MMHAEPYGLVVRENVVVPFNIELFLSVPAPLCNLV